MKLSSVIILVATTFFFSLMPVAGVNAETCGPNAICPKTIELVEKTDNIEIITDASISGAKVNVDVKMLERGDFIKYKLTLENTTADTYLFGGVRPMVSLKKVFKVQGGDDTSAKPFVLGE